MEDEKIVFLFFNRDENAISELDAKYGAYFRSTAKRILNSESDAEETVNDVYLKAWNIIPPNKPVNLRIFISKLVRQLSINRLEAETAQKRGGSQYHVLLDELSEALPSPSGDPAEDVALRDSLTSFLRALKPDMQRVFIKRYFHMYSVSEISKETSYSESKVKSMLLRMRNELKKHLEKDGINV